MRHTSSGRQVTRSLSVLLFVVTIPASGIAQAPSAQASTQTHVLFMCPHGAAKSVLASAYFQQLARERGLDVRVEAAGTQPDPAVSPAVVDHLTKNGYRVPVSRPRLVTSDDLSTADVVISLGCDLAGWPASKGTLQKWDDVPGPGEDFAGADRAIRRHVAALVDELLRRSK
jgi:arsenate reductase